MAAQLVACSCRKILRPLALGAMIHSLQPLLLSRAPGCSVMPPKGRRGLLKEAGRRQGGHFQFGSHRASSKQRQGQPDSAAPSILAPEVPGYPDLLTQTGCPPLLTLARGRKLPHKHLTAASVFCPGSGPGGTNSNKPPLENACWRWGGGWGERPLHLGRTS